MLSVDRLYRLESLFKYGRFLAKLPLKFSICSRRSAVPAECCGISKKNKTPRFQNCTWRVYLASLSSNSYCTAVAVPVCLNVFEQTLECHHSNERYSVSNSIKRYSWFVNAALNLTSWSSIDLTIKFAHKVSRKLMLRSILLIYLPIGFQTASNLIIKLAQKARSKFMLLHFSWYTHLKQPGKKNKTKQNKQTNKTRILSCSSLTCWTTSQTSLLSELNSMLADRRRICENKPNKTLTKQKHTSCTWTSCFAVRPKLPQLHYSYFFIFLFIYLHFFEDFCRKTFITFTVSFNFEVHVACCIAKEAYVSRDKFVTIFGFKS